jgi:choline dehydrogenase-like flavoprotein
MRRTPHLELTAAAQTADGAASAFAYITMDLAASALVKLKEMVHGIQQRRLEMAAAAKLATHVPLLARTVYWRFARRQLYVPPDVVLRLHLCIEQLPDASNRMRLGQDRDRLGLPIAVLDWGPKPVDEHTLQSATARLENYWQRSGFAASCPIVWSPFHRKPGLSMHSEDYAHPSGTTRMGADPRDSVLDPDLRCHGIANVHVASASAFPSSGSANPSLTVMALALRLADRLVRERRR